MGTTSRHTFAVSEKFSIKLSSQALEIDVDASDIVAKLEPGVMGDWIIQLTHKGEKALQELFRRR